jgi:hypothetical protein
MAPPFLTLALDGGEWSALCPGHFTTRDTAPGAQRRKGWVGSRSGLHVMENKKSLAPAQN